MRDKASGTSSLSVSVSLFLVVAPYVVPSRALHFKRCRTAGLSGPSVGRPGEAQNVPDDEGGHCQVLAPGTSQVECRPALYFVMLYTSSRGQIQRHTFQHSNHLPTEPDACHSQAFLSLHIRCMT
jgi:hypothetical protein